MRIHSDVLKFSDIHDAARIARVDVVKLSDHGSRRRSQAFDVKLEGESRRRPNGGSSGAGSGYAATWDQWGVFLAVLFERDPEMLTPYYTDAENFADRTADRFGAPEVVMGSGGYREEFKAYGWPEDAHGDHKFEYAGQPRVFECRKCSATQRYGV